MKRAFRQLSVAVCVAVIAVSCSADPNIEFETTAGPAVTPEAPGVDDPTPEPEPSPTPVAEPTSTPEPPLILPLPKLIEQSRVEIEDYWEEQLPATYGVEFEPVKFFQPYFTSDPDTLPPCGGVVGEVFEYLDNAFYCGADDRIAWDAEGLMPDLLDTHGNFAVALVIAHEYGHAIQERAGENAPTILIELQADCLAGAWAGAEERGELESDLLSLSDFDAAVAGYLELRDPVGTLADEPGAHGSGFDRLSAFFDGFNRGPSTCVDYDTDPPVIADIPLTEEDFETGGDLPLDQLEPLIFDILGEYWADIFGAEFQPPTELPHGPKAERPTCGDLELGDSAFRESGFYCTADNSIIWDEDVLVQNLWDQSGDGASMYVIVNLTAQAALVQEGIEPTATEFALAADCLTGAFFADLFLGSFDTLFISAGDLDELLIGMSTYEPSLPDGANRAGAALPDRVSNVRAGFDTGFTACQISS